MFLSPRIGEFPSRHGGLRIINENRQKSMGKHRILKRSRGTVFYKRLRTPQIMSKGSNAKSLAGMVNSDVVVMLKIRFSCERIGQFQELGNPLAGMVDPGIGKSPNWGIP